MAVLSAAAIFGAVTSFAKGLISPATEVVKGWSARKAAKLASDLAISEAKTKRQTEVILTGQQGDIAWENTSIGNSGWKDEYLTIVLTIPAILCFFPAGAPIVTAGFVALSACPVWYQWGLSIVIGSAFGVKEFTKFMSMKKGA
jgi:hypothetical protein